MMGIMRKYLIKLWEWIIEDPTPKPKPKPQPHSQPKPVNNADNAGNVNGTNTSSG